MRVHNRLYPRNISRLLLVWLLAALCLPGSGQSPDTDVPADSLATLRTVPDTLAADTLPAPLAADTLPSDSLPSKKKSNPLDAKVEYAAQDSIVFWSNGTGFLHGEGDVKYKNITLKAEYIRVKMDSSLLYAKGMVDSIGDPVGDPVFGEGESEYNSKEITYNLQTGKGFVKNAVTQQGEGYIVSDNTKKVGNDNMLAVAGAKYTTCDDHNHPHFYLNIKKGKVQPGKHIVSGPAQLVVADVPLPLVIPFGFFPFTDQYSSGLLMPTFADELTRGMGLVNGGYYFAFNDYFDLELRGEVYTKGTWGITANTGYIKKYKFSGNVNINYREDVTGERDMPDYQKAKSFRVSWSHRQDAKANPYRTLSASVNFSTAAYNRNNINTYYDPAVNSQNTKSSSITFTQRFARIPALSISGGMQLTQRTSDSTINLSLPNLSISVSTIYPFKRKNPVGKERWYEKISLRYTGTLANSIQTKENLLFRSSFTRDWKNGMRHSIPISASFNLFNYITVTPNITYNERWHTSSYRKHWDDERNEVVTDTVYSFNRNYDFSGGISAQTKLYGYYIPFRKWFGDIPPARYARPALPREPRQTEARRLAVEGKPVPADAIYKAFHMGPRDSDNFYACDIISDILSNGQSSRLYVNLIKNSKLFSEIEAYVTGDMDPGLFVFSGKLSEGVDIREAEEAIQHEIERFIDDPISERELQKVINKTEARIAYSEINYQGKSANLAFFDYLGDIGLINRERSRYECISLDTIKATAREMFAPENSSTLWYLKDNHQD